MHYAFLSDVHSRIHKLQAVLADAQARGANQIVSLGDVGDDECVSMLRQVGATAVFGNYEVSGWRRLKSQERGWVQRWPPLLAQDGFLAVHAAPWWPQGLHTIEDFGRWLKTEHRSWQTLFPYLTSQDDLWRALAELEQADASVLFHGHTHRQAVWEWGPERRLLSLPGSAVQIRPGARYLVGVGSVGLPEDQCWAAYTLYDTKANRIEQVRLGKRV